MIPARAHFCWIGPSLPWAYVFAVLSAARQGKLDEVILHHTHELREGAELRALASERGVLLSRIDPLSWMEEVGGDLAVGGSLAEIYRRVENPVARSNMLRAAVLHLQGGLYLDLDTITVAPLSPLLAPSQLIGVEYIVWPHFVRQSRSPRLLAKSGVLSVIRDGLRKFPHGYRYYRNVAPLYYRGINGAILGAAAKQPLMAQYLRAMAEVPREVQTKKHALGTHLLQQQIERYGRADLTVCEPDVFYPLAPEISEHWFRIYPKGVRLEDALAAETRVVHWYASVRTKPLIPVIDPAYVARHAATQLYSALVQRYT